MGVQGWFHAVHEDFGHSRSGRRGGAGSQRVQRRLQATPPRRRPRPEAPPAAQSGAADPWRVGQPDRTGRRQVPGRVPAKPATFEAGLTAVTGYPNWDNGDVGDVHGLAALDCYSLENGGEASGSTMQAYRP